MKRNKNKKPYCKILYNLNNQKKKITKKLFNLINFKNNRQKRILLKALIIILKILIKLKMKLKKKQVKTGEVYRNMLKNRLTIYMRIMSIFQQNIRKPKKKKYYKNKLKK